MWESTQWYRNANTSYIFFLVHRHCCCCCSCLFSHSFPSHRCSNRSERVRVFSISLHCSNFLTFQSRFFPFQRCYSNILDSQRVCECVIFFRSFSFRFLFGSLAQFSFSFGLFIADKFSTQMQRTTTATASMNAECFYFVVKVPLKAVDTVWKTFLPQKQNYYDSRALHLGNILI